MKLSQGTSGRTKGTLKRVPASWLADDSTCSPFVIRVRHHEVTGRGFLLPVLGHTCELEVAAGTGAGGMGSGDKFLSTEDLVQLSLGEDQRPLNKAAVVGLQGQTHDNKVKVYFHGSPDGWKFVFPVPSSRGTSESRFLLNVASSCPGSHPAQAELGPF